MGRMLNIRSETFTPCKEFFFLELIIIIIKKKKQFCTMIFHDMLL